MSQPQPEAQSDAVAESGVESRRRRRVERTRAARYLWVANLALGCLVAGAWLVHALPAHGLRAWLFPRLALLSTVTMLSLPVLLVGWIVSRFVWNRRVVGWTLAVLWTVFLAALWFDTRIFDLFRYHVNGLVWNVIATHGLGDSVQIGAKDWIVVGTGIAATLVGQRALYGWLLGLVARRNEAGRPQVWLLKPQVIWLCVLIPALLAEKGMYAVADLRRDRSITSVARLFLMYQRVTIKGVAERVGMDIRHLPEVSVAAEGRVLDYPRGTVAAPAAGPRPNILIVVVDSLRADAIDAETAPRMHAFAGDARRFTNHVSSGNGTRFGIFGLIYGITGVYWHPVYAEQRSPLLVDVLLDLGYDMRIFSTAQMSSPELRSTAWVRIEPQVVDDLAGGNPRRGKVEGDRECGRRLAAWLDARGAAAGPWFSFMLLDSPHQQYDFPRADPPFQPYLDQISYLTIGADLDEDTRLRLKNSYRNAVHHADTVVGGILDDLRRRGALDDTIVVITGDHGEEFGEHGFYGHTSTFTGAQIRVPFLVRGPGFPRGIETRPTSHVDLAPTLLEYLGVDPADRERYSTGESLLAPLEHRDRVCAAWDELALWTDDAILVVPYEAHRGGTSVYTYDWQLVLDDARILTAAGPSLFHVALECARFLR